MKKKYNTGGKVILHTIPITLQAGVIGIREQVHTRTICMGCVMTHYKNPKLMTKEVQKGLEQ